MPWLARLKRRFSPRLLRLGADGAQPLPGGGTAGVLALVGRELCLYLQVDASRVPTKQRAGFVALAVRRAAPFADPEHDILWLQQGQAAVWYWSHERARSLVALPGAGTRYRAEAVYRGEVPSEDTEQLLALDVVPVGGDAWTAGLEARVWRQGRLHASRWWPQLPDANAWQTFARGAGLDASQPRPQPVATSLREQPLSAGSQRLAFAGQLGTQLPLVAAALATLVTALLVWQVAGVARAASEVGSIEQRIDRLSARLEKIITARENADAAQVRIDTLLALRAPASQTRLLGEVKRLTPGVWQMMAWGQPSPEVLEVTLKMDNPDTAAIVAAWEGSPLLQEVAPATNSGPGQLTLQARLTPLREQAP